MKEKPTLMNDVEITKNIEAIKRLLILSLIKSGATQDEVAMALQIDRSVVSRMFPARKVKPFN